MPVAATRKRTGRRLAENAALVLIVAAAPLYAYWIQREYRSAAWSKASDREGLQRSVRIEPLSAEYLDRLGRSELLVDVSAAQSSFQRAIALCPSNARHWLDLAIAQEIEGNADAVKRSVRQAIEFAPSSPELLREATSLYASSSSVREAFPLYARLLAVDSPESLNEDLLTLWRSTDDASAMIDQALPRRAEVYVAFLRLLVARREGNAATVVWRRLLGLRQPFAPPDVLDYFGMLIATRNTQQLAEAWNQFVQAVPEMQSYRSSHENLVVNPGFKLKILNAGLDWRYVTLPHVALSLDDTSYREAPRSMSFAFDGAATDIQLFQFVPVRPDTTYILSGYFKADGLETASGPRLFASDAFSNRRLLLTEDVLGTTPWVMRSGEFHTGNDTSLVVIGVTREPATDLIRGKALLDDVSLRAK